MSDLPLLISRICQFGTKYICVKSSVAENSGSLLIQVLRRRIYRKTVRTCTVHELTFFNASSTQYQDQFELQSELVTLRNGKHSFHKSVTVILPAVHLCILSLKNLGVFKSQLSIFPTNSFDCIGPIFRIF